MLTSNIKVKYIFIFLLISIFNLQGKTQVKADFIANTKNGCTPLIVSFHDLSTGNPTSWVWDLGNGVISNLQNPITSYFDPGNYTIKLIVKNSKGQDSISKTSYIEIYENPIAAFSVSQTQGCFPLNVCFFDNSNAGSGTISKYLWDYGDGNSGNTNFPCHNYNLSGIFDVTLKVTNSFGCSNIITKSDLIQSDEGVIANFSILSLDVCKTPAIVNFANSSAGSGTITYLWDYGDGKTSKLSSPSHTYNSTGNYPIILTATSSSGCTDTATSLVSINFPKSSFSGQKIACVGKDINLQNTSVPQPISNVWDFGDGTTSTQNNPQKTYAKPGNYTIKLLNTFSSTCSDSTNSMVIISPGPISSFSTNDTANCSAPYTVHFNNNSIGSATDYLWDFGDGTTSSDKNPVHTYTKGGKFTVRLTASIANGCEDIFEIQDYIKILKVQILGLTNLPDSGCIPVIINPSALLNINTGIKKYTWDFGDGTTSNAINPIHVYNKEGFYNVKTTIETQDGCSDVYTLYNAVSAGHKPKANFTTDPTDICANQIAELISTSSNGPIHFLSWNYGPIIDARTDSIFSYKPNDTGYVVLTLVAYNYGCADTLVKDSLLHIKPPAARLKYLLTCEDKLSVNFGDSSVGGITRTWVFGDGFTDTAKTLIHKYNKPGDYFVNLIVNNGGCADTAKSFVNLINENGNIISPGKTFCHGELIDFDIDNVSTSNIIKTEWDFGNGMTQTVGGTKTSYLYDLNGTFLVKATMTDKNGCQYFYEMPDSVNIIGPKAKFNAIGACLGTSVTFNDESVSDSLNQINKWSWDFGDSNFKEYTSGPFIHTYADTGYYTVTLTVFDSYGCKDNFKKAKYVLISKPKAGFLNSDSVICPGQTVSFNDTSKGYQLKYFWNFDDGNSSTIKNATNTYNLEGTYNPSLLVTDVNGCKDSSSFKNLIVGPPRAKFLMSDSASTCPPLLVDFTNMSAAYTSFLWDFGDGNISTTSSPTHLYTYPGIYTVKLSLLGKGGCKDSLIKTINIAGPTGTINYDSSAICFPTQTNFSAITKGAILYTWDFGDGNIILTGSNAINHFYDTGYYFPKVILADGLGCQVLIKGKDTIHVSTITANAGYLNKSVCDTSVITFNDLSYSQDKITNQIWDFGDGNSGNGAIVTHTYTTMGNFTASILVENQFGCKDTFYIPTTLKVPFTPQISISGDSVACSNELISLKGRNAILDSSLLKWTWNFSDGRTFTDSSATTLSFSAGGNYSVQLIAQNQGACSDTAYKTFTINNIPNINAGTDQSICQNNTYELKATGAESYLWSGENLSCTNCQQSMAAPSQSGLYIVQGFDNIGCNALDTIVLKVIFPDVDLKMESQDLTLCIGQTSKLIASGAESYSWYPSLYLDNSNIATPTFIATEDTIINYKIIGQGENNCFKDSTTSTVKVFPIPRVIIKDENGSSNSNIVLNVGGSVKLETASSPDITSWTWQPALGLDNPTAQSPIASPKQTTTYTCLASNGGSCISRDEITVNVICKNTNVFVPNTFSPNGDGINEIFYARGNGLFSIKSFRVFNRWGQLIFEKLNATPNQSNDGWDGTYKGKIQTSDVFIYIMEVECENGVIIPVKGNITLLR